METRPCYLVPAGNLKLTGARNFSFYAKINGANKKLLVNDGRFNPSSDIEEEIAQQKGWTREVLKEDVGENLDDLFGESDTDTLFNNAGINKKEVDHKLKELLDLREEQLSVMLKLFPLPTCYNDIKKARKEDMVVWMRIFKVMYPTRMDIGNFNQIKNIRVDYLRKKIVRLFDDTIGPSLQSCSLISQ
jgi:hypothetical protein